MIRNIRHKGLSALFHHDKTKGVQQTHVKRLRQILFLPGATEFMPMKNPPHPGEIIRDLTIEPLELTVTQAAAGLGVSR